MAQPCLSISLHPLHRLLHSPVQYSAVLYSTVQCCTVQYSTVQYSTVQYCAVQYSAVQYSTRQCSECHHLKLSLGSRVDDVFLISNPRFHLDTVKSYRGIYQIRAKPGAALQTP